MQYKINLLLLNILSFLFLTTCEKQKIKLSKQDDLSKDSVYQFLKKENLYHYPEKLAASLDSANLNHRQIYSFCQKISDSNQKMLLATAVCQKIDNYTNENKTEYWSSIMFDLERFGEYIEVVRTPEHKSFMDVGSANGEKLYAALCLGFEKVYGIEYSPELLEISHDFLESYKNEGKVALRLADALAVEGEYYAQADLIYMYSPIKDHAPMAKLYHKIFQNMRNGAILIEVRMVYSKELRQISQLDFPNMMGLFAVRRQGNHYEYLTYDSYRKNWHKLEKLPQSAK